MLLAILSALRDASNQLPLVFPIHPRTRARIDGFRYSQMSDEATNIKQMPPLGYSSFLSLNSKAKVIVTDSGGLQEESTALGIPCLTMRPNTERPITVEEGTSTLIGSDTDLLQKRMEEVLTGRCKSGRCPDLWDGRGAERIVDVLSAL